MKTNVKDTSIDAFLMLRGSQQDLNQRGKIYRFLSKRKRPLTRQELSHAMHMPINIICGRVNELLKNNYVAEADRRDCKVTGASAHPIFVK